MTTKHMLEAIVAGIPTLVLIVFLINNWIYREDNVNQSVPKS